jgi:ferric-dicitrate binding protein FerR (iron transport regulator)
MLITAADFSSLKAVGSVRGVGNVQLRGVSVAGEGTLFVGDTITTGTKSRGDLIIADGSKVELFNDTRCVVKDGKQQIIVRLLAGNLGFAAAREPIAIAFSDFEVFPEPGTTGGVAFLGTDFAGIRVMNGSAVVRNLITGKSLKVAGGSVQIVSLKTAEMNKPIAQVASTASPALPSRAPMPQVAPGGGLTPTQWGLIGAGVGAVTVTAIYFAVRNPSPSEP